MKSKHLVAHLLDTLTTDTFVDTSWAWTCSLKGWNNLCMAPRASFTSQILVILKCMELILWLDFRISIRMISQHCKSETTEHVSGTCPTSQGSQSQTCLHKIVLSICLLLFHVISLHTYIISQKKKLDLHRVLQVNCRTRSATSDTASAHPAEWFFTIKQVCMVSPFAFHP